MVQVRAKGDSKAVKGCGTGRTGATPCLLARCSPLRAGSSSSPQDAYPADAGSHDYTGVVLNAEPPPLERRRGRPRDRRSTLAISCLAALVALGFVAGVSAETWRGLTVAPEHRCAPYDKRRDYPYPQWVERAIVRGLGAVYGPYTRTCFASTRETD